MATVTIEVPDSIAPQVLAALRRRYPDLTDVPDVEVGRQASARMFRETLMSSEMAHVEQELQAQMEQARTDRQAEIAAAVARIA